MPHPQTFTCDPGAFAEIHAHTLRNHAEIMQSHNVRCICCLATMPADAVTDYTDGGLTAVCPCCGTDAIVGDAAPFLIDDNLLKQLQQHYF